MTDSNTTQSNTLQFLQSTHKLSQLFSLFLQSKGQQGQPYEPNVIRFTYNELNFAFITDPQDPFYFRIILLNIYDFDNNTDMYNIINQLNTRYKVGKCFISAAGKICLAFEQFIYTPADSNYFFERALIILKDMAVNFQNLITSNQQDD